MEELNLSVEKLLGELSTDENFASKITTLQGNLKKINLFLLEVAQIKKNYDKLRDEEKVQLDLLELYAINTLFFINLKLHGVDITNHPIQTEIKRVREAMLKNKIVREKPKPRIDKKAAERFVRSGLWDPTQPPHSNNKKKFDQVDTVNYDRW